MSAGGAGAVLERVGRGAGRIVGGLALVLLWIFALSSPLRGRAKPI